MDVSLNGYVVAVAQLIPDYLDSSLLLLGLSSMCNVRRLEGCADARDHLQSHVLLAGVRKYQIVPNPLF